MNGTGEARIGRRTAESCDRGFRLRTQIAKLRWLGLDGEADRIAADLGAVECARPASLPLTVARTD